MYILIGLYGDSNKFKLLMSGWREVLSSSFEKTFALFLHYSAIHD